METDNLDLYKATIVHLMLVDERESLTLLKNTVESLLKKYTLVVTEDEDALDFTLKKKRGRPKKEKTADSQPET